MHNATISRAVAGKYLLTPHGLMEMRAFFASGYHTGDGEEVSNTGVRQAIQQLVTRESPVKPLTDAAITRPGAANTTATNLGLPLAVNKPVVVKSTGGNVGTATAMEWYIKYHEARIT